MDSPVVRSSPRVPRASTCVPRAAERATSFPETMERVPRPHSRRAATLRIAGPAVCFGCRGRRGRAVGRLGDPYPATQGSSDGTPRVPGKGCGPGPSWDGEGQREYWSGSGRGWVGVTGFCPVAVQSSGTQRPQTRPSFRTSQKGLGGGSVVYGDVEGRVSVGGSGADVRGV